MGEDTTNPKDRLALKKVPLDLVPMVGVVYEALAFAEGARKYGEFNWRRKNVRRRVYLAAILRHTLAALAGEDIDPDSGLPHEAKIRACCGIILDAQECGALIDDRFERDATAAVLARHTEGDYHKAAEAGAATRTPARTLAELEMERKQPPPRVVAVATDKSPACKAAEDAAKRDVIAEGQAAISGLLRSAGLAEAQPPPFERCMSCASYAGSDYCCRNAPAIDLQNSVQGTAQAIAAQGAKQHPRAELLSAPCTTCGVLNTSECHYPFACPHG
jgi:hypothetical protein